VNVLILSVMTIVDPVEYRIYPIREDRFSREIETYGTCNFSDSDAYIIPLV
jgi:hypothetical protein